MTLMEMLLIWNTVLIPHEGLQIIRTVARAVVFIADAANFEFGCDNFNENELPYWDIYTSKHAYDLVPRRAHPIGWCRSLKNQFDHLVEKSHSKKLRVFGFSPLINLPPDLPGMNFTFHSIKNEYGDCVGHFIHACEETEQENWEAHSLTPWSVII